MWHLQRRNEPMGIPRKPQNHHEQSTSIGWNKERRVHPRSEEHTSELQSPCNLVCRLLLEKKNIFARPRQLTLNRAPERRQTKQPCLFQRITAFRGLGSRQHSLRPKKSRDSATVLQIDPID